jgi:hypothetical protein
VLLASEMVLQVAAQNIGQLTDIERPRHWAGYGGRSVPRACPPCLSSVRHAPCQPYRWLAARCGRDHGQRPCPPTPPADWTRPGRHDGSPVPKSSPGHQYPVPPSAVTVINPAVMPAGTELFFDYVNNDHNLIGGVIYTGSYTCISGLPHGGPPTP